MERNRVQLTNNKQIQGVHNSRHRNLLKKSMGDLNGQGSRLSMG